MSSFSVTILMDSCAHMQLLDHLSATLVKYEDSRLIWRDLLEGEEEPNMKIVSNGKF
jgi:hypothetical protein